MSQVKLSNDVTIDAAQIVSAKLVRGGEKTGATAITLSSADPEEITAPEDELIVHLQNGTQFAIRGEAEVNAAWEALTRARDEEKLKFQMAKGAGG
jgi:hypothetical protein